MISKIDVQIKLIITNHHKYSFHFPSQKLLTDPQVSFQAQPVFMSRSHFNHLITPSMLHSWSLSLSQIQWNYADTHRAF